MKPKIGTKIYVVECGLFGDGSWSAYIFSYAVGYLGKESFVTEGYRETIIMTLEEHEFLFKDYGERWFTSLKAAKAYARKEVGAKRIRWEERHFDDDGRCDYWRAEAEPNPPSIAHAND